MNYSVEWTEDALTLLAAIWLRAAHRNAVAAAQARIDRLLRDDPRGNGRHQSEGLYTLDVHPLRVQFEVSDPDRLVTVVGVRELP